MLRFLVDIFTHTHKKKHSDPKKNNNRGIVFLFTFRFVRIFFSDIIYVVEAWDFNDFNHVM